jgi:hypothetical protein
MKKREEEEETYFAKTLTSVMLKYPVHKVVPIPRAVIIAPVPQASKIVTRTGLY